MFSFRNSQFYVVKQHVHAYLYVMVVTLNADRFPIVFTVKLSNLLTVYYAVCRLLKQFLPELWPWHGRGSIDLCLLSVC